MEMKILNFNESQFRFMKSGLKNHGMYAFTFNGVFDEKKITLKRATYKSVATRQRTIKEWFILKIASAL